MLWSAIMKQRSITEGGEDIFSWSCFSSWFSTRLCRQWFTLVCSGSGVSGTSLWRPWRTGRTSPGRSEVRDIRWLLVVRNENCSGISGGFEAGLQLSLTLWLVLKGVIPLSDVLSVHWRRGSYGNYSPSIPLISALSSFLSMVWSCIRNIANTPNFLLATSLVNNPICSGKLRNVQSVGIIISD